MLLASYRRSFRSIWSLFGPFLVSKVARNRQNGPRRGTRHPHRTPSGRICNHKWAQRPLQSAKMVPLGRLGPPCGRLLGGLACLLVLSWTPLGLSVTTFCVKRLNQGKPRIPLEKRSPSAFRGGQDGVILGNLGPKMYPRPTHVAPKRVQRQTKSFTSVPQAPPNAKKLDLGVGPLLPGPKPIWGRNPWYPSYPWYRWPTKYPWCPWYPWLGAIYKGSNLFKTTSILCQLHNLRNLPSPTSV